MDQLKTNEDVKGSWDFIEECSKSFSIEDSTQFIEMIRAYPIYECQAKLVQLIKHKDMMDSKPIPKLLNVETTEQLMLSEVTRVMLYRLKFLESRRDIDESNYMSVCYQLCSMYKKIILRSSESPETVRILSFVVLHSSRIFLDPRPDSINNVESLLNRAAKQIRSDKLIKYEDLLHKDLVYYRIFEEGNNIMKGLLESQQFHSALDKFKEEYQVPDKNEVIIGHLKRLILKIVFVKSQVFLGMVGLDQVYISMEDDELGRDNNQEQVCQYIITLLHVFADIILMKFKVGNYLASSPRGQSNELKQEAGFQFEQLIFGTVIANHLDVASEVLNIDNWKGGAILNEQQIQRQTKEVIKQKYNLFFSGIYCKEGQVQFK